MRVRSPDGQEDSMKRRRHTPEQIIRKLREADRLLAEGREVPEVAKQLEISEATYHRWRAQSAWERPAPFRVSRGSSTLAWTEPHTEGAGRCPVSLLLVVSPSLVWMCTGTRSRWRCLARDGRRRRPWTGSPTTSRRSAGSWGGLGIPAGCEP